MSNARHYSEIYDYLSAPALPVEALPTVVFGRNDARVAHAAGELAAADLADIIVITGGTGKDTGDLLERGYRSEAHYLDDELTRYAQDRDVVLPEVALEEKAKHGGQNAEFSLRILSEKGVALDGLTSVAHATSSLRLAEGLKHAAQQQFGVANPTVYRVPTNYDFDPENPADQKEAAGELLRLADWPDQGMLPPKPNLPLNLVDFARDRHGNAPKQPSKLATAGFSLLPPGVQARVIKLVEKRRG